MEESESAALSLLRFSSVCFIVLCHFLQGYGNRWAYIFNVGVQVFFLISGFIGGKKYYPNAVNWYKRRLKRILVPYYIYIIIIAVLYFILSPDIFSFRAAIVHLMNLQGVTRGFPGVEHLWFITWIIVCYMLTPFASKYGGGNNLWMTSAFVVLGAIVDVKFINVGLYLFAFLISRKNWDSSPFLLGVLFFLTCYSVCIFDWTKYLDYTSFDCQFFHIGLSLFLFVLVISATRTFPFFSKLSELWPVRIINKFSYEIYITHHLFILGTSWSLLFIFRKTALNVLFIIVAFLISSFVLQRMSRLCYKGIDRTTFLRTR